MTRAVFRPDPLSRPALAFGSLVALAVLMAAFGPKATLPPAWEDDARARTVEINFLDEPDGAVTVIDAATGASIARLGVGEGGFVRSAMRGLARERIRRDIGREPAFRLQRQAGGALVLNDPQTGKTIRLDAFGQANAAAFAAFLDHGREK